MKTYNMIAKTLFALTCVCCSVRGSENGIQQKKSSFSSSKSSSSSSSSIHRISSGPEKELASNRYADGAETTETAETTEPAMTTVTTEPAMTTVTTETTMTTDDNSANENEQGNIKEEIKAIKEDIKALMEDREGSKSEASGSEESGSKQNTNQLIFSPVTKYIEALGKAIRKDVRAFMEDRKGKNARRMEMTRRKESKSEARGQESGRKKQNIDKVTRKSNGSAKEWSSNAGSINEGKKETRQSTKFQKFSSKRRMVTKQTSAKSP